MYRVHTILVATSIYTSYISGTSCQIVLSEIELKYVQGIILVAL